MTKVTRKRKNCKSNHLYFVLFFALDRELENIKLPQQCRSEATNLFLWQICALAGKLNVEVACLVE